MFHQDFLRIKAQFNNNIASAFMAMGDYIQADKYNNEAIIFDPDYIASYLIKCQIYEDTCEYTMCMRIAKWALERCDLEDDEEDCTSQLEAMLESMNDKLANEQNDKAAYLRSQA